MTLQIDADALAAKVASRKAADDLLDLALSEAKAAPNARELLVALHAGLSEMLRLENEVAAAEPRGGMSDDEARKWERHTFMTFGAHKGKAIKDVPLEYLLWLDEDDFRRDLHDYLASGIAQREQDSL